MIVFTQTYVRNISNIRRQDMNFTNFRKNTSFGKFLCSFLLNRLGDSVDVLTMSWLIYLLSGSAAVSALAMGINYIPSIVIQPASG